MATMVKEMGVIYIRTLVSEHNILRLKDELNWNIDFALCSYSTEDYVDQS